MHPGDLAAGARYVLGLDSKQNDVSVVSERRGCRQANPPGLALVLEEKPIGADRVDMVLTPDQAHIGASFVQPSSHETADGPSPQNHNLLRHPPIQLTYGLGSVELAVVDRPDDGPGNRARGQLLHGGRPTR